MTSASSAVYKYYGHNDLRFLLMIAALVITSASFAADQADAILGLWTTEGGNARAEVVK